MLTELGWAFGELFWQDPLEVVPRGLRPFIDHPESALERLTVELRVWWRAVLGARWGKTVEFLDWSAERLAASPPSAAFWDRLDPSSSLDSDRVLVKNHHAGPIHLDPSERVTLVPSAFAWPMTLAVACDAAGIAWAGRRPMLSYLAPGFAELWDPTAAQRDALANVVGRCRAALLRAVRKPRSTTELADALRPTPGAISQQLKILHEAGLVIRRRDRRLVYYRLSRRGDAMLSLFDHEPEQ